MKNLATVAVGALLALSLTGCASIVHGTNQQETFVTEPTAANIRIDGIKRGRTPLTIKLARADEHIIQIHLPGYKPANFTLTKHLSGWTFGNIVFGGGGVIGVVVDLADGAMYYLKPDTNLQGQVIEGKKNTLTIILAKKLPRARVGRKIGQLIVS
jgi:hypothetical protein